MTRYPQDDSDSKNKLLTLLGTFWSKVYRDKDAVRIILQSALDQLRYHFTSINETVDAIGRKTTPVCSRPEWKPLVIREENVSPYLARYGDTGLYYNGPPDNFLYDTPLSELFVWTLPNEILDVFVISDRFAGADRVLVKDLDFTVDKERRIVVFRFNPLEEFSEIVQEDDTSTRTLLLWSWFSEVRKDYLYDYWGYAVPFRGSYDAPSKDLVNTVFDATTGGTTRLQVRQFFALTSGVPLIRQPVEVVQAVYSTPIEVCVITDLEVYKFSADTELTVEVGDTVHQGDSIAETLQFFDLNTGTVPAWMTALYLDPGYLVGDYSSGLTFENEEVPLEVSELDGRTVVQFAVGGRSEDVALFWDEVHARGLAQGRTLAQYLDLRSDPSNDPTADSLPETVNPAQFVVENLLRFNLLIVRMRTQSTAPEAVTSEAEHVLRTILPPWSNVLVFIDAPVLESSYTADQSEDNTELDVFDAAEALEEIFDSSSLPDSDIDAWLV